jgi:uncharacterized protein YpmB
MYSECCDWYFIIIIIIIIIVVVVVVFSDSINAFNKRWNNVEQARQIFDNQFQLQLKKIVVELFVAFQKNSFVISPKQKKKKKKK